MTRRGTLLLMCLILTFGLSSCKQDKSVEELLSPVDLSKPCMAAGEKVGVLYVVHGGFVEMSNQHMFDVFVQMFGYDPNHFVYKMAIWNPQFWPYVLYGDTAREEIAKHNWEYNRIGGTDPFNDITTSQLESMDGILQRVGPLLGVEFISDWVSWINGDLLEHYPWPRYFLNPPVGPPYAPPGAPLTYCGEPAPWEGCDPMRYDVDGPAERMLAQGVDRIVMIDMTTSGVRFFKTYNVVQMTKGVVAAWNAEHGTDVQVSWVNDPNNLMEATYPTEPENWTYSAGDPIVDPSVPLEGNPNPVVADPFYAYLMTNGIATGFSKDVSDEDTAVILLNHATRDGNEVFDPKINDTLTLNQNIEKELLRRYDLDPDNIIGAFMGIREVNPENGLMERTREMRGESMGYAWLYETDAQRPGGKWGYFYWDALELLKDRGVEHIVIGFPQIVTDSVLNFVEIPNQIAREIGYKTWAGPRDETLYPGTGDPFADYWGIWVDTDCDGGPCCLTMGGCDDGRVYPPPRQTPIDEVRSEMDPSLAFDVSEFGHLGYDPALGAPDPDAPVQDQYRGTWAMYEPINDEPLFGLMLAKHVILHLLTE